MANAMLYPADELPRRWPHFDAGWYIKIIMYATFGPYTREEARGVYTNRMRKLGFLPDDDIFYVAEPSDMDVLHIAHDCEGA